MPEAVMELIGIKVPADMRKQLEELAESDKRPMSAMARILIEEALIARSKKAAKKQ